MGKKWLCLSTTQFNDVYYVTIHNGLAVTKVTTLQETLITFIASSSLLISTPLSNLGHQQRTAVANDMLILQ